MNSSERTRLEKLRQLKAEIRGSQEHLMVGIDVAKEKHHAFFGTRDCQREVALKAAGL